MAEAHTKTRIHLSQDYVPEARFLPQACLPATAVRAGAVARDLSGGTQARRLYQTPSAPKAKSFVRVFGDTTSAMRRTSRVQGRVDAAFCQIVNAPRAFHANTRPFFKRHGRLQIKNLYQLQLLLKTESSQAISPWHKRLRRADSILASLRSLDTRAFSRTQFPPRYR